MTLSGLLGGTTLGGTGLETAFQIDDMFAVALQTISGDTGGLEGSLRLRVHPTAGIHSGIYRKAVVQKFPYIVVYRYHVPANEVTIAAFCPQRSAHPCWVVGLR